MATLAKNSLTIAAPLLLWTAWLLAPMVFAAESPRCADGQAILPIPRTITVGEQCLSLPSELSLVVQENSPRLQQALQRFAVQLKQQTGQPVALIASKNKASPALTIQINNDSRDYPALETDEAYQLTINGRGIELQAASVYGVLWGLQTLRQLARVDNGVLQLPFVTIEDKPRFAWRGMMLDTVRHFMPIEAIERLLDGMEAVKLNVLHLHLTDNEGFSLASESLPQLHLQGSNSGQYYSREDMAALIEYAANRGIRVMPEFGLPDHSDSWQLAYPQLSVTDAEESDFSNPVDPTRESTYEFIDTLVAEMSQLFPDPYWHIGGDEVDTTRWESSPSIKAFMTEQGLADSRALQAYFSKRYAAILKRHGKITIGWDEVLHPDLSDDVVVHAWREVAALEHLGEDTQLDFAKHPVLVSANYYLDLLYSAEKMYRHDPTSVLPHSLRDDDSRLLGAEMNNWSETITGQTLDVRTWPRAGAVAERFWSPREAVDAMPAEYLYQRLESLSDYLDTIGLLHKRNSETLIRGLAGSGNDDALMVLASVAEPRHRFAMEALKRWQTIPEFISAWWNDADMVAFVKSKLYEAESFAAYLPPESLEALAFRRDVRVFVDDPVNRSLSDSLRSRLQLWKNNHQLLAETIKNSPTLREHGVDELSMALEQIAEIGLICLDLLSRGVNLEAKQKNKFAKVVADLAVSDRRKFNSELKYGWVSVGLREHQLAIQPGIKELLESVVE